MLETASIAKEYGWLIEAHIVPNWMNWREIPVLVELLKERGFKRISFLRFVPQGRGESNLGQLALDPGQFYELQKMFYDMTQYWAAKGREERVDIRLGDPIDWLWILDKGHVNHTCSAAKDRILIRANGEAQFCAALKHTPGFDYGNVFDTDIVELWDNSSMARTLRTFHADLEAKARGELSAVKGRCRECEHIGVCKMGCLSQRIAEYKDMYRGPDPLCPIANGLAE